MSGSCECNRCGKPIFWFKSARTGNSYPCDSPSDKRSFHKCSESRPQSPQPQPTKADKPLQPDYFQASLEERVANLENLVARLSSAVNEISRRQPVSDSDIPF